MINIRTTNIYYNYLLIRHIKNISIYKNLLKKKPYLVVCNIFDRNPKPSSICALDAGFNIGLKHEKLDINLSQSLSKSQFFAYNLGNNLNYKLLLRPFSIIFLLYKYLSTISSIFIFFLEIK